MTEIECHCQEMIQVNFPEKYELEDSSSLVDEILNGEFMSVRCPHCGNTIKAEETAVFLDPRRKFGLVFYPEILRSTFLLGHLSPEKTIDRVAIGYKELREKVKIYQEGKDDRAIELLKMAFLQRQERPENLKIYYKGQSQEKLEFYIERLDSQEIQVSSVPAQAYEKSLERLGATWSEDWDAFLTPPYVQANQITWET